MLHFLRVMSLVKVNTLVCGQINSCMDLMGDQTWNPLNDSPASHLLFEVSYRLFN
jgi:hypothetical protein